MPFQPDITAAIAAVRTGVGQLHGGIRVVESLDDATVVCAQRALAEVRQMVDACASVLAGEIGRRSRRELGYSGLAQREGFRSPAAFVQHTTGSTARDAAALVRVGQLMHDGIASEGSASESGSADSTGAGWERLVGQAAADGSISVQAADAICTGLRDRSRARADDGVEDHVLAAVTGLIAAAPDVTVEALLRRARDVRDEVDASGIADRERIVHQERAIRRFTRPNGVSRYIIDPDIESGAFWDDLYDCLTSPRRGGVRFVDPAQKTWADQVASDPRTIDQYVHDSVTELLRISATADQTATRRIVGGRAPSVRVLATEQALISRTGHGRIEGAQLPISIESVERNVCTTGTVRISMDGEGRVLDLGREQRLFTPAQRIALAARDGGCRHPDCDRPPSWTEAHHIQHWKRDRGKTDIADGVLLCRFHHMLLHNNHWEIERRDAEYWLLPPPDLDPSRTPRAMPSKSAAFDDLLALRHAI